MQSIPLTFVIRHRKENLKKCSLTGLERHPLLQFLTYPFADSLPDLPSTLLLAIDGPPLHPSDASKSLLLLDGTWRYAEKMRAFVESQCQLEVRSIPPGFRTAYPRKQTDCSEPEKGLASVEALYIAHMILGRETSGLLDHYYWKEPFLALINSTAQNCRSSVVHMR